MAVSNRVFDPDMTYRQSLKIIARGLIQWPLTRDELGELLESGKQTLIYCVMPFARAGALLLLPISAPIFAWIVQRERRLIAAAKVKMRASIHQNGPVD